MGQRGQELPGGRAPDGHHLLEADGQQGPVGREAAAAWHQAVVHSYKVTQPGGTLICQTDKGGRGKGRRKEAWD